MQLLLGRNVPAGDEQFKTRCNQSIDMALRRLASEAPGAILPSTDRVQLLREYVTGSGGVTTRVSSTADDWVISIGTAPFAAPDVVVPTNNTWDGLYWVDITLAGGEIIRRQCREFWVTTDLGGNVTAQYASLVTPLLGLTFSARPMRLYQPYVYLPWDNTDLLDATLEDTRSGTITTMPEGWARATGVLDGTNSVTGMPVAMIRGDHFQLDAPQKAPVATAPQDPWAGPEAVGQFSYKITYAWGKRDGRYPSEFDNLRPLLESGPSPVSNTITVPTGGATAVLLTLPDIDWAIRFNTAGTLRQTHSGLVKRIYRARHTVGTGTVTALEARGTYEFLAEVDGATTTFLDDGSRIPDYYGRLPEISGYYRYRSYPAQDATYRLLVRATRRPRGLDADQDEAPVSPECVDALLYLAVSYMQQYGGEPDLARISEQEAARLVGNFKARHASPSKVQPAVVWGTPMANWSSHAPMLTWTRFTGP